MARRLSIPPAAIPNLALIAEQREKLPLLASISDSLGPARRTIGRVVKDFAAQAELPAGDARRIVTQIASMNLLCGNMGISPSELFDNLTTALTETHADKVNLQKWKAAKDILIKLFSPENSLGLVQKSTKLRYDFPNILHSANVLTDARPVFDSTAREIEMMSVVFTLQLEYSDGARNHTFYAAMDARDIARLKAACERAETKAATLKEKLKSLSWPIQISGGENDDD